MRAAVTNGTSSPSPALILNEGLTLRHNGGGRDRKHIVGLQGRVRNAPDVPKLIEDQSVSLMHRLGDPMPRLYLLTAVDARRPGVALALHRNLRCFAHDQRCGCTLRVVAGGKGARHVARLSCARARQRRHGDAMPQIEWAEPVGHEQHIGARRLSGPGCPRNRGCLVHFRSCRWDIGGPDRPSEDIRSEAIRLH